MLVRMHFTILIESQIVIESFFQIQNVTKQNYTIKVVTPDNTSFVAIVTFLTHNVTAAVFQPVEGTTVYTSSSEQCSDIRCT